MVGHSLFCMRDPGSIPGRGSIFLEILSIAIFFFRLQGLDFIESSFACIQSFGIAISSAGVSVTKTLLKQQIFCRGMHVGKNMMNIHKGVNQGKTSMSKGALVNKFTNPNSFLIVKQGNINKKIISTIYINKTENIGLSRNVKILTNEADESNGR